MGLNEFRHVFACDTWMTRASVFVGQPQLEAAQ